MKIARSARALKAICGGRAVGADSPHIMDLDVDRPIDFDEKDQKVLCEQHYVKKFEALLNACSIFVHPTEEFISRGKRRFFYIEAVSYTHLTLPTNSRV